MEELGTEVRNASVGAHNSSIIFFVMLATLFHSSSILYMLQASDGGFLLGGIGE
jgi:hypothetical protein